MGLQKGAKTSALHGFYCCILALQCSVAAQIMCVGGRAREKHVRFNRLWILPAGWREAAVWVDCAVSLCCASLWGISRLKAKKNIYICSVRGTGEKPCDAVVTSSMQWWGAGTELESLLTRGPAGCWRPWQNGKHSHPLSFFREKKKSQSSSI